MRVSVSVAIVIALFTTGLMAADWAESDGSCYAKGDKNLSFGIPLYPFGVNAAFDYGFHDAISGGGAIAFRTYYFSPNYLTFLGRAAFHPFNLAALKDKIKVRDKLDVYVGPTMWLGIGLGNSPDHWIREYIGARFYFSPKLSVFAEDCAGLGYINVGLSLKL
jgi:hypothetical protein